MKENSLKKVKEVKIEWSLSKRAMMEVSIKSTLFSVTKYKLTTIIENSAFLLTRGSVESKIYDILVAGSVTGEKEVLYMTDLIFNFCKTVPPYEFVVTVQRCYLEKPKSSAEFNTIFIQICNLIFSGYNCGYLIGISPQDESLLVEPDMLCPAEFITCLQIYGSEKFGSLTAVHDRNVKVQEFSLSNKQKERLDKKLTISALKIVYSQLNSASRNEFMSLLNNCIASMDVIFFTNYFNYLPEGISPFTASTYQLANWQREKHPEKSLAIDLYTGITDLTFGHDDLLKHRNIYLQEKGIIINFKNKFDGVEKVYLREYHDDQAHLLYVGYTIDRVYRHLFVDMTSLDKSYVGILFETDATVMIAVMLFLGLKPYLVKEKKDYLELFKKRNPDAFSYELHEYAAWYRRTARSILDSLEKYVQEDNIYFEVPEHWNYTANPKEVKNPWEGAYLIKDRKIGRYSRRLPAGQKASSEAKALAAKVFMDLGEDKTIVDEFVRKVKMKGFGKE